MLEYLDTIKKSVSSVIDPKNNLDEETKVKKEGIKRE